MGSYHKTTMDSSNSNTIDAQNMKCLQSADDVRAPFEEAVRFPPSDPMDMSIQGNIDAPSMEWAPESFESLPYWEDNFSTSLELASLGIQARMQDHLATAPNPSLSIEPGNPCDITIDTIMETISSEAAAMPERETIVIEKGQQYCPLCGVHRKDGAKEIRKVSPLKNSILVYLLDRKLQAIFVIDLISSFRIMVNNYSIF